MRILSETVTASVKDDDCDLCPPSSSLTDAVTVSLSIRCWEGEPQLHGWVTCNSCNVTIQKMAPFEIDLASLCASTSNVITTTLPIVCGVFTNTIPIKISRSAIADCPPLCDGDVIPTDPPPPPSACCDQSLWFCLNNQSVQLDVDGGTHVFDVAACCNTQASLEITLSCTSTISLSWVYTAGVVVDSGTVSLSQFCSDGSPRIITFNGITCFLQMLVSQVEFGCVECLFGDSPETTDPPPP